MSKYIKLKSVLRVVDRAKFLTIRDGINTVIKLENLPTIEVSEGEWIVSEDGDTTCSVCGASEEEFIFGTENWYGIGISNYCPNCGAKMKGEE